MLEKKDRVKVTQSHYEPRHTELKHDKTLGEENICCTKPISMEVSVLNIKRKDRIRIEEINSRPVWSI